MLVKLAQRGEEWAQAYVGDHSLESKLRQEAAAFAACARVYAATSASKGQSDGDVGSMPAQASTPSELEPSSSHPCPTARATPLS